MVISGKRSPRGVTSRGDEGRVTSKSNILTFLPFLKLSSLVCFTFVGVHFSLVFFWRSLEEKRCHPSSLL